MSTDIAALVALRLKAEDALERLEKENGRLRVDAERYRWLRTRINWSEQEDRHLNSLQRYRAWTHRDYRYKRPESEHIYDYIDAAIRAALEGKP